MNFALVYEITAVTHHVPLTQRMQQTNKICYYGYILCQKSIVLFAVSLTTMLSFEAFIVRDVKCQEHLKTLLLTSPNNEMHPKCVKQRPN